MTRGPQSCDDRIREPTKLVGTNTRSDPHYPVRVPVGFLNANAELLTAVGLHDETKRTVGALALGGELLSGRHRITSAVSSMAPGSTFEMAVRSCVHSGPSGWIKPPAWVNVMAM